jgi:RHS repeat-associated protein
MRKIDIKGWNLPRLRIHWVFKALNIFLIPVMLLTTPECVNAAVQSGREKAMTWIEPKRVSPPPKVQINRKAPPKRPVSAGPQFSRIPTDQEIFLSRVLEEPLIPSVDLLGAAENRALGEALKAYTQRKSQDDFSALTQFVEQHPQSRWKLALLVNLGLEYRRAGWWSKALDSWEEAWALGKTIRDGRARNLADRAGAELAELNARLGRYERLKPLFAEIDGRTLNSAMVEKVANAKSGLWMMDNKPEDAFRCGPMALDRILAFQGSALVHSAPIKRSESTRQGMSLSEVQKLSKKLGLDFQMAQREPGAALTLPAVVHWKVGHYAALLKEENGKVLMQDPTFGGDLWLTRAAVDAEASGYFLVPKGDLPAGWTVVAKKHGEAVFGKGNTNSRDPNDPPPCDECPPCNGMAVYYFHKMLTGLVISDIPIGYQPPRGPAVNFQVTYNHKENNQPATFDFPNLGPKWRFMQFSYLSDNTGTPSADVTHYLNYGGQLTYTGYNGTTQKYAPQQRTQAVLHRVSSSPVSYELLLPNGAKEVYDLPTGSSSPRKVLLTQVIDAAGNALTYSYDGQFRVTAITDAIGQVTTIDYDTTDTLKIVKVTDPFGREATFDYDGSGRLEKITDVLGLESEFTYGAGDFISAMETPYGTTTFSTGGSGNNTWLQATDPLGDIERVEYRHEAPGIASTESVVPSGITVINNYLQYRNSFYWDKKAWINAPGDYTKAELTHWLHTSDINVASGIVESVKRPYENRVWYLYAGQSQAYSEGSSNQPTHVARVLDNGATQLYKYEYNSFGKPTKITDPLNRSTSFSYSADGIDLLEVRQTTGGTINELLASFTYNADHLPETATDAAGEETEITYNAYGQPETVTNAKGETTTIAYYTADDTNKQRKGRIHTINGPLSGSSDITTFDYDGFGRVRTVTDSEGYVVTMDYDDLDRPTVVTYPDTTYEEVVYDKLDAVQHRDRTGKWTKTTFNATRQATSIQDALGRITSYEYCKCGAIAKLTDALGRVTEWKYDLQGRVTRKIFADTTVVDYAYESTTSRLKKITDAKGQSTNYAYNVDNSISAITYTNEDNSTPDLAFTYDPNYARVSSMTDGTDTTNYTYYAITGTPAVGMGQLFQIDGPLASDVITFAYDELGRVTSRSVNSVSASATFDVMGRTATATNPLGTFDYNYVNATGRLSSVEYPNGQLTNFSYFNNAGDQRLQQIQNLVSSGGSNLSTFAYTYRADGMLNTWSQQIGANPAQLWTMGYDTGNQLASVAVTTAGNAVKNWAYGFDKGGNRTSEQLTAPAANPIVRSFAFNNLNQMTGMSAAGTMKVRGTVDEAAEVTVGSQSAPLDSNNRFTADVSVTAGTNAFAVVAEDYSGNVSTNNFQVVVASGSGKTLTYDANGNLIGDGTRTFEWDAEDRLLEITQGSNTTEFTYDGLGRRVKIVEKTSGSTTSTKQFVYVGNTIAEERDGSNNVVRRYYGQGFEQVSGTAADYFYTRDHLGSVREITDSGGTVQARYDYDPYGKTTKISGSLDGAFLYTGHYWHWQSGLYLSPTRAYDPELGIWLSRDPIAERGGINLYAYVGNAPINHYDPFGLKKTCTRNA